jgi:hypothetical protein
MRNLAWMNSYRWKEFGTACVILACNFMCRCKRSAKYYKEGGNMG